jgi:hypothetical protein
VQQDPEVVPIHTEIAAYLIFVTFLKEHVFQ